MKKTKKKVTAAIIVIGNEILSGRTQDINVSFLSRWLNNLGVRVVEVRIIEDVEKSIVDCVNEVKDNFDYIFTTGGIGPTHDDITSKSIAKAFNLSYGYHKEAYDILEKYYKPGKFNKGRKKMAKIYKVKLNVVNRTIEPREEIIKADSPTQAKLNALAYCKSQLVDNDRLKNIVDVSVSENANSVVEIKEKDLINERAGTPQKY